MEQVVIDYQPSRFYPPRTAPWVVGSVTFIPGVKAYKSLEWAALQKNSKLKAVIEGAIADGILRVISTSSQEDETPPLPKNQQEAIALVNRTFSMELLEKWKEAEKRKVVLEAISAQISGDTKTSTERKKPEPISPEKSLSTATT